jgi:hypothetical protein
MTAARRHMSYRVLGHSLGTKSNRSGTSTSVDAITETRRGWNVTIEFVEQAKIQNRALLSGPLRLYYLINYSIMLRE